MNFPEIMKKRSEEYCKDMESLACDESRFMLNPTLHHINFGVSHVTPVEGSELAAQTTYFRGMQRGLKQ